MTRNEESVEELKQQIAVLQRQRQHDRELIAILERAGQLRQKETREKALQFAMGVSWSDPTADGLVERAKVFEAYLEGEPSDPDA